MSHSHRLVTRDLVRRFRCPRCGARPGDPCIGTRGERVSNHIQRVHNAVNVLRAAPRPA